MQPDSSATAAAAAAAPPPWRGNKRLIFAAAAAALVLLLAAAIALAWPSSPSKPAKKARRAAAVASAASAANAPAVAAAAQPASVATDGAATPSGTAASPASAPPPAATATAPAAAAAPAPIAAAMPAAAEKAAMEEAAMDRLQRRLGEVLGVAVTADAARPGELRVHTRAGAPHPGGPASGPAPLASLAGRAWSYSGVTGPRAWARLDPAYSACASGREQSPIDLRGGVAAKLAPVNFDYRPGRFELREAGHTVQLDAPPGNAIELDGARYELQQLHFHRPSEERIDGRQFEMDVHLVHRDAAGRLAVVAVLLQRGAAQPVLDAVWQQLAGGAGDEMPPQAALDPRQLLPQDRRYYSYLGSLTTPPCTEGVRWLVLQQPLTVSAAQIDAFAQRYSPNARPLQPPAGRVIRQSM